MENNYYNNQDGDKTVLLNYEQEQIPGINNQRNQNAMSYPPNQHNKSNKNITLAIIAVIMAIVLLLLMIFGVPYLGFLKKTKGLDEISVNNRCIVRFDEGEENDQYKMEIERVKSNAFEKEYSDTYTGVHGQVFDLFLDNGIYVVKFEITNIITYQTVEKDYVMNVSDEEKDNEVHFDNELHFKTDSFDTNYVPEDAVTNSATEQASDVLTTKQIEQNTNQNQYVTEQTTVQMITTPSTQATTKNSSDTENGLTDSEIESLENFINYFSCTRLFIEGYHGYDTEYNKFLEDVFFDFGGTQGGSRIYGYFFGNEAIDATVEPDPLNRFASIKTDGSYTQEYYKYNIDNVEWMCKHVFRRTLSVFKRVGNDENYIKNGNYYMVRRVGYGDYITDLDVISSRALLGENNDYDVTIKVKTIAGTDYICSAVVSPMTLDGRSFWAISSVTV